MYQTKYTKTWPLVSYPIMIRKKKKGNKSEKWYHEKSNIHLIGITKGEVKENAEKFEEAVLENFLKLMKDIKYRVKKLNKCQREF